MRISDWSSDVCSSDLEDARQVEIAVGSDPAEAVVIDRADRGGGKAQQEAVESEVVKQPPQLRRRLVGIGAAEVGRSEEHTSELQSLMRISYAVFCLKTKNHTPQYQTENKTNKK